MRVPTDAQARVIAYLAEHEAQGRQLFWFPPPEPDASAHERWLAASRAHSDWADLAEETMDRERNTSRFSAYSTPQVRVRSLAACVKAGWISTLHERIFASGVRGADNQTTMKQLDVTAEGDLALGVWRQRKARTPPETPVLAVTDRAVIDLALRARDLGYAITPVTEDARTEARRMRKDGWIGRGSIGRSATSIVPTSTAIVEVDPDRADMPDVIA